MRNLLFGLIGCAMLAGCSTTNCNVAMKTLDSAEAAYVSAVASGNLGQIEKYKWTLDAARAVVVIWCAGTGEIAEVK